MSKHEAIISAIDNFPLNRGLRGADWLSNPENIAITFPNGDIALFDHEGDHDYQGHLLFVSGGRVAINHAREAFAAMFEQHGAELLFGLAPVERRDVKLLLRWAGAKFAGQRPTPEGECDLFVLSNIMWKGSNQ